MVTLSPTFKSPTYTIIQVGAQSTDINRYIVFGLDGQVTAAVDIQYVHKVNSGSVKKNDTKKKDKEDDKWKDQVRSTDELVDDILSGVNGANLNVNTTNISGTSGARDTSGWNEMTEVEKENKLRDILEEKYNNKLTTEMGKIESQVTSIVQNQYNFPKTNFMQNGIQYYDYSMDYFSDTMMFKNVGKRAVLEDINELYQSINIDIRNRQPLYQKYLTFYNRYKLENADDHLTKSFAHVFFVRPDCNLFSGGKDLLPAVANIPQFYYSHKHSNGILQSLTHNAFIQNNTGGQFMFYLSNKARSFEISDEYINADTYGSGMTGYKIPYGRSNVESKTAKTFSIKYIDDRDLHVYQIHKMWVDYISMVFRGKLVPKQSYILNKILDYATCVYYILTAEDGETIIFWSKYWGVFPVECPSSSFSFSLENSGGVKTPEINIQYQYAWKDDFDPLTLVEFNEHSMLDYKYVKTYNDSKIGTGYTWSGAPFIETYKNNDPNNTPYTFKLRFRPDSGVGLK